jgi:DNA-binding NarL/FixJ family response regulator
MDRPDPIRVAIADDHPLYRDGVRTMIESLPGLELVGEAADTAATLELVERLAPDVLLLDLDMPGGGGMEVLRVLRDRAHPTAALVLTMHEEDSSLVGAMKLGARGYVPKSSGRNELGHAISTCAAGGVVFGAGLAERMAGLLDRPHEAVARAFPTLTPRERDVLERLARGENNETIARVLGLSPKTVRNQVSNVLNKLEVPDRAAAIVLARDAGLGRD